MKHDGKLGSGICALFSPTPSSLLEWQNCRGGHRLKVRSLKFSRWKNHPFITLLEVRPQILERSPPLGRSWGREGRWFYCLRSWILSSFLEKYLWPTCFLQPCKSPQLLLLLHTGTRKNAVGLSSGTWTEHMFHVLWVDLN